MTIGEIAEVTKKSYPDIYGIKVIIADKSELTIMGNPTEIFEGELANVPQDYMCLEILERSQICASSDERREGAHVLVVSSKQL